jgi:hypothetical protein
MMLAGIGGLVYAHRKRGGQMTLESFKQSGRDLMDGIRSRATDIRSQAETRLHDAANRVADRTNQVGDQSFGGSDVAKDIGGSDVSGFGSGGSGYGGGGYRR